MKGNKFDKKFLRVVLIFNLIVLIPIVLRKPPIKDWLLVFLFNALTNIIADSFLTSHKIIKYPVRFFPKLCKIHVLFDLLIYPTFTILYNQITMKDKPLAIFYKLFYFTIPMFLIELWAYKKTNLIKWNKGWKWYHSFISLSLKSLKTRSFIGVVRWIEGRQKGCYF